MIGQTAFRAALLAPDLPVPQGLSDGAGRPAGQRYDVYRNNVAVSLREALRTGFPALLNLLGQENFDNVAREFLRQCPPSSPLMMHYGAEFPEFLAGVEQLASLPYLPDVARIELAVRHSYHAADADPIDPAALAALDEPALMATRLRLAPSVQVLASPWPVLSIWQFATTPDAPKPQAQAEELAILRAEYDPVPVALPPYGAAFLQALMSGQPFGTALQNAPEDFDLPAVLHALLAHNAITALE